jgi:hypothetical protein
MRESRRRASEAESNVSDVGFTVCAIDGASVFPAKSGNDQEAERSSAMMMAATELVVELLGCMGVVMRCGRV